MTLRYKFKKEKLENGKYVSRPTILVKLNGKDNSMLVPALIVLGRENNEEEDIVLGVSGIFDNFDIKFQK